MMMFKTFLKTALFHHYLQAHHWRRQAGLHKPVNPTLFKHVIQAVGFINVFIKPILATVVGVISR
jgi:hypothetical protein